MFIYLFIYLYSTWWVLNPIKEYTYYEYKKLAFIKIKKKIPSSSQKFEN